MPLLNSSNSPLFLDDHNTTVKPVPNAVNIYLLCLKNTETFLFFCVWLPFMVNRQGFRQVLIDTFKLNSRSPEILVSL